MKLNLGDNLKKLRRKMDITQEELAEKIGVSTQAISRYETGSAYPDIEMLPIIAGFFGVTVDTLLGLSGETRQKRKDEYITQLRQITNRKERLDLLRKEHAEFPDSWEIVSDMVYEMGYVPECIDEMRETVEDAMNHCGIPLWRENIMFHYLRFESDSARALAFIDKWASKYNVCRADLMKKWYSFHDDGITLKQLKQYELAKKLKYSFWELTERNCDSATIGIKNCLAVLSCLNMFTDNDDPTIPDMWIETKLMTFLRLANNYFAVEQKEEGYRNLEKAVSLFENFFSLPDGTELSYGMPKLNELSAKTNKNVFFGIRECRGLLAESMMIDVKYATPVAYVNSNESTIYDSEGFEGFPVFTAHTYDILKNAIWDGFLKIKEAPRYIALLQRVKKMTLLENIENFIFLMKLYAKRTDEWIMEKKFIAALYVSDVGAYTVFDNIEEVITRMKLENNIKVQHIAVIKPGGWLTKPPKELANALIALDSGNKNSKVILDTDNKPVFADLDRFV